MSEYWGGICVACNGIGTVVYDDPILFTREHRPCESCLGTGRKGSGDEYMRDSERFDRQREMDDINWNTGRGFR